MREPETATQPSPAPSLVIRSDALPMVILNPVSNNGRAARLRRPLERALTGGRGELALTTARGDATRLAAEAARAGRPVVAVGGDGLIHEAAEGVLSSGVTVPFGVIPAGNGNDFATYVAFAPTDMTHALEVALTAPIQMMDVGVINGRHFVNAISVGLDANVSIASERFKRLGFRGQALYMTSALSELLFHYDGCPTLTVQCDDAEPIHHEFVLVAVSIGPAYGGGFMINPGADPQDGLFDVCIIRKPHVLRALRLLPVVERGEHLSEPEVTIVRARRVSLATAKPANSQEDGEISSDTRFEVAIRPGALALRRGTPPDRR
ncbi:MAG TPA: diacylglycerol kinase family protein [Ktedonobacterales bacterium]